MIAATPRRELATRDASWTRRLASGLARAGVRPDAVSVASVFFAGVAAAVFVGAADATPSVQPILMLAGAAAIQLRLLCNLLDGMLAVEEGLKTKRGDLFNEIPDRVADVVILAGAGYAVPGMAGAIVLGWAAAAAALFTAYVRVLGGSLGVTQRFIGPMAKQHRMFALTLASIAAAAQASAGVPMTAIYAGLVLVIGGALATAWRRIARIAAELEAR